LRIQEDGYEAFLEDTPPTFLTSLLRGRAAMMRFQQNVGVEAASLQDEMILFHGPSKQFCVLNRTSSFIWSQLKEPVTIEEIARRLQDNYSEVVRSDVVSDVDTAVQRMLSLGLIVHVGNGGTRLGEINHE
jgi:hypothetical protein